jgi:uncharacterized protein YaaR (DUF327 family)
MNNRIDLTQEELRDKLYDWMTKGYEPQMAVSDDIPNEISEILFAIDHLGLIAELKRCYEEIDELKELCHEFLGQALTLYDVGNQHKDVDYDYREFNKLRTRFAELLDFKSASE